MIRVLQEKDLEEAAQLLREGKLVAFPTETVYGLGAALFLPQAIEQIFVVKGRPADNPLIVHISDLEQVEQIARGLPQQFERLAAEFWPGPLTIVVSKAAHVPEIASAHLPTIGVRLPSHPLARALIRAVGMPLVAPSANLSGRPSATCVTHVQEDFEDKIAAVLEGECGCGLESTILMLEPIPMILRPGPVTAEEISRVLGCPVQAAPLHSQQPLAPGMKYRHYAPAATLHLVFSDEALHTRCIQLQGSYRILFPKSQTLYQELRDADREGVDHIVVYCDAATQANAALMNRLMKAAGL